ncbi:MAG: chloride channel protein [Lachnospiraceae bacterium]|nr:chloride channel protein [Lachnospiraceae bacterium]
MRTFRDHNLAEHIAGNLRYLLKWTGIAGLMGVLIGGLGTAFYYCLSFATRMRMAHPVLILFLPFGGLLIALMYYLCREEHDRGTNLVITAITSRDQIRIVKAPLIFAGTVITHLFGGSCGREGAALQLGGCIGQNMGFVLKLDDGDRRIITMCGMSAAFASQFGTPMAAAFMAMEISSVGVLYYASLVPCVISAFTAAGISRALGTVPDAFTIDLIPEFTLRRALLTGLLGLLCAVVSILFCVALHRAHDLFERFFPNLFLRIFAGGVMITGLSFLCGLNVYNGSGIHVIEQAFETGSVPQLAFLLKILFTAITMGSGFKGGEIVPSFYVGATFGNVYAHLIHGDPDLCTAVGMAAVFCGITNCPITSLLICFEMFGYAGMPYFLIAISIAYTFSDYFSIFGSQKIVYSKLQNAYVNHETL